jgi:flagellar hook-associated protein FlgK
MFGSLSATATGLYQAVARATQSANNIANASLTGKNIDEDMVNLIKAQTDYAANAKVIQTEGKMQRALLDISV